MLKLGSFYLFLLYGCMFVGWEMLSSFYKRIFSFIFVAYFFHI